MALTKFEGLVERILKAGGWQVVEDAGGVCVIDRDGFVQKRGSRAACIDWLVERLLIMRETRGTD